MSNKARVLSFPEQLRQLSTLLDRSGLASRAGLTFEGERDLYAALGYKVELTPKDYRSRYRRGGIAARVVEAYPTATWRGGIELIEDEDPQENTAFEEAFQELDKRIKVFANFGRADILAGLGRYAIILIGAPGKLESPMPKKLSADKIIYLAPYGEEEATITKLVEDPKDERFGLPLEYTITRRAVSSAGMAVTTTKTWTKQVHWSRIIHVAEGTLDDRIYGTPRLERVWNDLDNLDKVSGAGSEAFWLRAHQGVQFNLDKEVEVNPDDVQKMKDEIAEFAHGLKRSIMTRGTEMDFKGSDVANFDKPVDTILTMISGATGIPKRILMGSERGELASTQDRENWDQRVTDRRTDFAEPMMLRPFVDGLIESGALPTPVEYKVQWAEIESLTEVDQANIADKWSKLNSQAKGVVVRASEIRDKVLRLEPLTDAEIAEEEESLTKVEGLPGLDEEGNPIVPDAGGEGGAPGEANGGGQEATGVPPSSRSRGAASATAIADASEGRFHTLFNVAVDEARSALDLDAIFMGSAQYNLQALETEYLKGVVAFRDAIAEKLAQHLVAVVVKAARSEDRRWERGEVEVFGPGEQPKTATLRVAVRGAAKKVGFDANDPATLAWATKYAAQFITNVTEETRLALSLLVAKAQVRGWTPQYLTHRVVQVIGLNKQSAAAVLNLRQAILDNPGGIVRVGKSLKLRVPRSVPSEWLERQLAKYEARLLKDRGMRVAHDLATRAASEGRRRLWRKLRDRGDLPATTERIWRISVSSNVCPICIDLDGTTAPLDEPYDAEGGEIMGPPAHPLCNCHEDLYVPSKRKVED